VRKVLSTPHPQPVNMRDIESLLPDGKGVWIPIDHGISDYPVKGLENLEDLIQSISHADAIVAQKGVVSRYSSPGVNMVAHLSVSTRHAGSRSSDKILVGSVEESLSRGAKGVSVQVNMGSPDEPEMIERLGMITQDAHHLDCPVLGMIYPRGENLDIMDGDTTSAAAHAARLAFELGCDVVKTKWTGSIDSFKRVTSAVPIPVLIAGGPAGSSTEVTLTTVFQAMQAGGGGVCMGRQVFSHESPSKMVTALRAIVHDGADVKQAMEIAGL
jgi:DhnA family fructose-bisphosphate aldolase class Ia